MGLRAGAYHHRRKLLKPDEIRKLDAYFKRAFQNPRLQVKARPRKDDSAEVYIGDEFLGIVFKDEDDGDYNFSMAILDVDLDGGRRPSGLSLRARAGFQHMRRLGHHCGIERLPLAEQLHRKSIGQAQAVADQNVTLAGR